MQSNGVSPTMLTRGTIVQIVEFSESRAVEILCERTFRREWFEISKCKIGRAVKFHYEFRLTSGSGWVNEKGYPLKKLESCHFIQCPSKEFKNGHWISRKVLVN